MSLITRTDITQSRINILLAAILEHGFCSRSIAQCSDCVSLSCCHSIWQLAVHQVMSYSYTSRV